MHYSTYSSDIQHVPKRRRWLWWVLGLGVLLLVGWFAIGPIMALRKIQDTTGKPPTSFFGSLGKVLSSQQLKGEADGRINILLLGIGGANHPGGTLADTIQVVSINTADKEVAILSVPRDLYVCKGLTTTRSLRLDTCKINEVHAYGERYPATTGGGPALMKQVVGEILGIPIHYYVRMDFGGFEKVVDAVGGVDVNVDKAISDPFFPAPDMIHYQPFSISTGLHHMDGALALKYVRSRETTSDFDRSRRQQQVLEAIKAKALTLNILANPAKVSEIAGILGDHVRTDFATWEMTRAVELAASTYKSYTMVTHVLSSGPGEPLVGANLGAYYLVPRAGMGNFADLQRIAKDIFTTGLIEKEAAKVEVVNATGIRRTLSTVVAAMQTERYSIVASHSTSSTISQTTIYDYTAGGKPNTAKLLGQRFGVSVTARSRPTGSTLDFSVILGTDYHPTAG